MDKLRKISRFVLVAAFALLLLLPLVFLDWKSTVSESEKRLLAPHPKLTHDGTKKFSFFKDIDRFVEDRFGFRSSFVKVDNIVRFNIFKEKGTSRVHIGRNGWLYYVDQNDGDEFRDYLKANLLSDTKVEQFARDIKARADWCYENGIAFIFLMPPSKHNVYPEYYSIDRPLGISRADQLTKALDGLSINYLYPRDLLLLKKTGNTVPLYLETDTHWNQLGAYFVYQQLFERIKKELPNARFPDVAYTYDVKVVAGDGDLVSFMGFKSYKTQTNIQFKPDNTDWSQYFTLVKDEGPNGIVTEGGDKSLPNALIYRDSFFSALLPFTSCIFSRVEYRWKRAIEANEKEEILKNKPDIIIWEVIERFSPTVHDYDF